MPTYLKTLIFPWGVLVFDEVIVTGGLILEVNTLQIRNAGLSEKELRCLDDVFNDNIEETVLSTKYVTFLFSSG